VEQLKPILEVLKKNHFWIVCVIAVGVILSGWYMAIGELETAFTPNKAAVNQLFKDFEKVNKPDLPGQSWPVEVEKRSRELHDLIITNMESLHAKQDSQWPALGNDFVAVAKSGRGGKWTPSLLEKYQKNMPKELAELHKISTFQVERPQGDPQAGDNVNEANPEKIAVEIWDPRSFETFKKQFEWSAPPAPEAVCEAQEKMWIAKAILRSVAAINKDATDKLNLPISAIEVFEIGPSALQNPALRTVESSVPRPTAPIAAPPSGPPGAPAATPGAPKAAPKAAPAPAPVAPPAVVRTAPGMRPYPVRLRMKMAPDTLPRFLNLLMNEKVLIIVDDLMFQNVVKTSRSGRPVVPAAPAVPGPRQVPGARPAAAAPGAPPRPGAGPEPAPQEPGPPPVAEGPPHLVQVPRDSVVELQATSYLVDMALVQAFKTGAPK
jgi:hypothetical protein